MRTEAQMLELILGTARDDKRIRSVILNGSRANPNVPRDIFQDFDIVYAVTETQSFIADKHWIDRFGEPLVIQQPDYNDIINGAEIDTDERYAYLMQFADGNRFDLSLQTKAAAVRAACGDSLSVVLLDKDGDFPVLPAPSDKGYYVEKPTAERFFTTCNEFNWISLYVAKGLRRGEILFALDHFNFHWRTELMKMLSWLVGTDKDFTVNVGKCGKYLKKYLSEDMWSRLMRTYPSGDIKSVWEAFYVTSQLFDETAALVAERLGFRYNSEELEKCTEFARHIQTLPSDAAEII